MESKGNLLIGQGRDGDRVGRSPAADLFGVRDSSLETLHASVMCLVAAPGTPGQHAAASYRGRGGAGEDEGPAAEGESHPELGYCRANHPPAAPQPPGPESTSRKSGESPYAASHRTREQGLYRHVVVDTAQEANVMVSGRWSLGHGLLAPFTSVPKLPCVSNDIQPRAAPSLLTYKGLVLDIPVLQ